MNLTLFMLKLSSVLLLLGSVINAASIELKETLPRIKTSFRHLQLGDHVFISGSSNASLLDTSALRFSGNPALNVIKTAERLSGYFATIVYGDDDCKINTVFGYGFLLGACVVDYEFSTSTMREANDTAMTIYSFDDTACRIVNLANPSNTTEYKEGVCVQGEKQFLRATIDISLPGQSITERYS